MDDRSSFRNKWLFIVAWLVILVISYLIITSRIEGFWSDPWNVILDLGVFIFFMILWMAFFAQFVLPVRTFIDRQKIFDRLFRHLTGSHGPALFIENGDLRAHSGETLRRGPGVVWLDSASASLIRTATSIRKIIGPGVHFTEANEYIEQSGTLDLHIQAQRLGPRDPENLFRARRDDESQEQYDDIQGRRRQVSGLSRDGIELVPDISISFRVNTGFPNNDELGSRFGFRTGTTKEAKVLESQDQEMICRALLGEGINPSIVPEAALHRVAWNRLPGMMAADIWRDYVSKFKLEELFDATQVAPSSTQQLPLEPTPEEFDQINRPQQVAAFQRKKSSFFVRMLRDINNSMERTINSLERRTAPGSNGLSRLSATPASSPTANIGPSNRTALQVINEMVRARLTQPFVDELDEYGKRTGRQIPSEEFKLLQIRGLKVLSASVSNVRMHPDVQEALIKSWTADWLKRAKAESEQLDLRQTLIETAARDRAHCEYAKRLSIEIQSICKKENATVETILMAVLHRIRALIRSSEYSNSLRLQMGTELLDIEDMIKWMGENV